MSNTTREINRITTTIISISVKLIVYALIILLLYEAVTRGYAFGHEVFYAEAMEEKPGRDMTVSMKPDTSVSEAAKILTDKGVIKSEFAFIFQSKFYDYDTIYPGVYDLNTSMTSKEILQALNVKPEGWEDEEEAKDQTSANRMKTTDESGAQPASAKTANADAADGAAAQAADSGAAAQAADTGAAAQAADTGAAAQAAPASIGGENGGGEAGQAAPAAEGETADPQAGGAPQETHAPDFSEDEEEGGWIEDVSEGAGR